MSGDILQWCCGSQDLHSSETASPVAVTKLLLTLPVAKTGGIKEASEYNFRRKEKKYIERDSLLTELFQTKHGATLYKMFIIFSIMTLVGSAASDFSNNKRLNLGQDYLWQNIKHIPFAFLGWLIMFVIVLTVYPIMKLWSKYRIGLLDKPHIRLLWDSFFAFIFVFNICLLIALPAYGTARFDLAPVCTFGVLMEQARFFSKLCTFYREIVPRTKKKIPMPRLYEFVYFLAAPTFVYKDEYPRTPRIRWLVVGHHFFELVWTSIMTACFISRNHIPAMKGFRSVWLDGGDAIISAFINIVPTILILLLGAFSYFHSLSNLQAEITRFADRLFYKDWWNATSFQDFFTSWNTMVQDWLYYYIYLDVRNLTGSRALGVGAVFAVSGIVHEYVLSFFFRFFYPVLIILFVGVGLILKAVPTSKLPRWFGNLFLWICLPVGSAIILTAYIAEYFSRINCPIPLEEFTLFDYFIPRTWSCPLQD